MKHLGLVLGFCLVFFLSACQQPTDSSTARVSNAGSLTSPVQGTINSESFKLSGAVATASKADSNSYEIKLTGNSTTPFVYFTIESSLKSYTVTAFGKNGLGVYAYLGGTEFLSFDSGIIEITKVDVSAKELTGTLNSVNTKDGMSSLTGTFTAIIQ